MAIIQIPTNSETSKIRMKTPMKHCYSKSYSPESSLDYERQVMLQRCFVVVVFAVSELCITAMIGRRVSQRGVTSLSALKRKWRNINVLIVSERGESSHLNYVYPSQGHNTYSPSKQHVCRV